MKKFFLIFGLVICIGFWIWWSISKTMELDFAKKILKDKVNIITAELEKTKKNLENEFIVYQKEKKELQMLKGELEKAKMELLKKEMTIKKLKRDLERMKKISKEKEIKVMVTVDLKEGKVYCKKINVKN